MHARTYIHSRSGSRDGVALVIVLAFIVLLTILTVSFIAFSRLNGLATVSYSKSIQAQEIAQGGMQDILSDLHQEIIAGSTNYNTTASYPPIYTPNTNSVNGTNYFPTLVPARLGYPAADWTNAPNPNPTTHVPDPSLATYLPPTLVRVSRADTTPGGTALNPPLNTTYYTGTLPLNRASNANSSTPSVDGRAISPARWNKPLLLAPTTSTSGGAGFQIPSIFANTTASPYGPPDWVYVTRAGSQVITSVANVLPAPLSSSQVTPGNPSPVVGRYAYVIYDESALLDANVAGSPSTLMKANSGVVTSPSLPIYTNAPTATVPANLAFTGKSYLSFADLTQLPGLNTAAGQNVIDNFVAWRNASASAGTSPVVGTAYLNAVFKYATNNFLSFATSGNYSDSPLLSRQDLINYFANPNVDPNFNSSSATYSQALPYLGTFSRAVSAPTYCPPTDAQTLATASGSPFPSATLYRYYDNAIANAKIPGAAPFSTPSPNPNPDLANVRYPASIPAGSAITHYLDNATKVNPDGTLSTYTVNPGDPLLQNRFSLARINWLSQADAVSGNFNNFGTYAAPIQACFGLVWGTPGTAAPGSANPSPSTCIANGGNPCWNYVGSPAGPNGTLAPFNGTIETLDQVAKEGREPNFFELLKAAILNGSLGLGGGPAAFANGEAPPLAPVQTGSNIPYDYIKYNPYTYRGGPGGLFSYTLVPGDFANGAYKLNGGPHGPAQFPDVQIIQIGANIIDQYDADSYPTAIYFPYGNYTSPSSGVTYKGVFKNPLDPAVPSGSVSSGANAIFGPVSIVYGQENLPLLHRIYATAASPTAPDQPSNPPTQGDNDAHTMEGWLQPQLWNPYLQPTTPPANGPVNFEIRAYGAVKTYADQESNPAADPANPPLAWGVLGGTSVQGANAPYEYEVSDAVNYYQGYDSTLDTPSSCPAGTLVFSINPNQSPPPFCDTPRLLTIDSIPGITVDTKDYNPAPTSPNPLTKQLSNFPASNFPGWNTPQPNGNPAYPNGFSNDFAAFTAGEIYDRIKGVPGAGFYVTESTRRTECAAVPAVVGSGVPAISFALGWYPAGGSPNDFHPYSFITGIFEVARIELNNGTTPVNSLVGYTQTNDVLLPADYGSVDPRTSRFSTTFGGQYSEQSSGNWPGNNTLVSWNSQNTAFTLSGVPITGNFVMPVQSPNTGTYAQSYACAIGGWMSNTTSPALATPTPLHGIPTFYPGGAGVSSTTYPSTALPTPAPYAAPANTPAYYADPDGVVRPADGAYANSATGDGIMTFTSPGTGGTAAGDTTSGGYNGNSQHGRRPVILNRPFRSVGELGYVFRDEPFKTLDFFTKYSADAALLDVFSLTDESKVSNGVLGSVVAGQFNPSNAPLPVLQAVLAGGSKKDFDPTYNLGTESGTVFPTLVSTIATALNPTSGPNPLLNRAALVTQIQPGLQSIYGSTADQANKAYLEAPVRALADVTNTRTWNLLIDIIAQSGHMSPQAQTLNDFVVEGERRYWLHVAIDRYTGKIVDQQLEPVYE